jgi:5'-phosphate synthase pdxT subunit
MKTNRRIMLLILFIAGTGIFTLQAQNREERKELKEQTVKEKIESGIPVLATCAGMILLASDIAEQDETYFETIPMTVKRNAYGRQLGSFHTNAEAAGIGEIPMTFIRAPFVESVHADASGNTPEILSIVEDRIVGVKYKNQMAFAFHPELDQDTRIHEAFLRMIK